MNELVVIVICLKGDPLNCLKDGKFEFEQLTGRFQFEITIVRVRHDLNKH